MFLQETGDPNPSTNLKLSQLVEQARKANMPGSTLNTALDKLKNNKQNLKSDMFIVRCPGGAMLVLHVSTNHITLLKGQIGIKLRKHK